MRFLLPFMLGAALAGCITPPPERNGEQAADKPTQNHERTRERELQSSWRGKTYRDLLEAFGQPRVVMTVPGYRPLRTSVAVFGVRDQASRCIDAFTVVKHGTTGEWIVADYFCR